MSVIRRFKTPNLDMLRNKHNVVSRAYLIRLQGKREFLGGAVVMDCPYPGGSKDEALWIEGWREEFFDNMDIVAMGGL